MYYKKIFSIFSLLLITNKIVFAENATTQTTLPLKFNTGNPAPYGLPSTVVSIQGKSIPLIFDTGAAKSEITLSEYALQGLHVKFTGKQVCFKSFDGKHCEAEFIIPELKLGNFILKNVKGTLMSKLWGGDDKGFSETTASRDGVIGYDLLSRFNVLLDYPHARAVLFQKKKYPIEYDVSQWIAIPFVGQLHTQVVLNGKTVTLGWDTGSVPSIIRAGAVENLQTVKCPTNTPYGKNYGCKRVMTQLFTTVSGSPMPATWFMIADFPSSIPFDGLVGSNFYAKNLVYLDFAHQRIYIKPL